MKQSKMQQVHKRFEELKMKEDKTIVQFNTQVQELTNEVAILGELFSQTKLVIITITFQNEG